MIATAIKSRILSENIFKANCTEALFFLPTDPRYTEFQKLQLGNKMYDFLVKDGPTKEIATWESFYYNQWPT